jgi:hypothetical protein
MGGNGARVDMGAVAAIIGAQPEVSRPPGHGAPLPGVREVAELVAVLSSPVESCVQAWLEASGRPVERRSEHERVVTTDVILGGRLHEVTKLVRRAGPSVSATWLSGPVPYMEERATFGPLEPGRTEACVAGSFDPPRGLRGRARSRRLAADLQADASLRLGAVAGTLDRNPADSILSSPMEPAPALG